MSFSKKQKSKKEKNQTLHYKTVNFLPQPIRWNGDDLFILQVLQRNCMSNPMDDLQASTSLSPIPHVALFSLQEIHPVNSANAFLCYRRSLFYFFKLPRYLTTNIWHLPTDIRRHRVERSEQKTCECKRRRQDECVTISQQEELAHVNDKEQWESMDTWAGSCKRSGTDSGASKADSGGAAATRPATAWGGKRASWRGSEIKTPTIELDVRI